jgi:hypothetical protein
MVHTSLSITVIKILAGSLPRDREMISKGDSGNRVAFFLFGYWDCSRCAGLLALRWTARVALGDGLPTSPPVRCPIDARNLALASTCLSSLHPGGMTDITRGLRSNATIPPGPYAQRFRIPEGCQTSEIQSPKTLTQISDGDHPSSMLESSHQTRSRPPRLSSLRDEERTFFRVAIRGCRIRSTPG